MDQDLLTMLFGEAPGEQEMRARNLASRARAQALRGLPPEPQVNMQNPAPPMQPPVPVMQQPAAPAQPQQPPARALPRALGGQQQPLQQAPPAASEQIDPYEQRQQELSKQMQEAMQPPDMSGAQSAYDKRAQGGGLQMALAAMAGEAGEDFKPFQAQHLKQAAGAREPMKMAGGTMTDTGFIEDPVHKQEFKVRQIQAQIAANDRIIQSNAARADKIAAEKRAADLRRELQASQQAFAGGIAQQAHLDRVAALGAKGAGAPTEGERSSAGYLGRMLAVEPSIEKLTASGRPDLTSKALGLTAAGRVVRPFWESVDQQKYRGVQEDWVRAKLRKESGASIPPDEMEREIETYFPQPGETDPAVIAMKAQARTQAAEQLRSSAGRAEAVVAPMNPQPAVPAAAPAASPATARGGGRRREDILKQYGVQ
jgi:hypothetical protein